MRLSVSNIAWDVAEDAEVATLMAERGVYGVDLAPSKYFPNFVATSDAAIAEVRAWWSVRGITPVGMQSLLYGTQGLNVFGPPEVQARMLDHLDAVCRIGAGLGATKLVFGSPKNRDRGALGAAQAQEVAAAFFHRLGEVARRWQVTVCLEPNPAIYGCNFMTTFATTAAAVRATDHPHVRMQLDTGALSVSKEPLAPFLAAHGQLVGHLHLSEPRLLPLRAEGCDHVHFGPQLQRTYGSWHATVEMLVPAGPGRLPAIAQALDVAQHYYGAHAAS